MQGYLTKPNKSFGSKKRFFVLDQSTLTYYETESRGEKLAEIFLNAQTRVSAVDAKQIDIENVSVGTKSSAKTSYTLMCDIVPQQRDPWVAALKNACNPAPQNDDERLKKEAEEAERMRLLREAEEAERMRLLREAEAAEQLRLQLEQARIEAQRRESDERARQQAEEADRLRQQMEQARLDDERREAEERALRQVEEQPPADSNHAPAVYDIPEPELDLKPREETPVVSSSSAVFKVSDA